VSDLQAHGVEILGSTILGFPHQKPEDLDREIEHALSYGCTYNQFMLYVAMPGTALWKQMKREQRLKKDFPWCDIHGQHVQNWHHPFIPDEVISKKLDYAFQRDFEVLGPSILRMIQTHYNGYRKTEHWDHELVQMRRRMMRKKFYFYSALLEAMCRDLKSMGNALHVQAAELRDRLVAECGLPAKLVAMLGGPYVAYKMKAEQLRYERSVALRQAPEPPCLVTHFGSFDHCSSSVLPPPGPTPRSVAIARFGRCNSNMVPLSAIRQRPAAQS
jgi:hypothetical protein